MGKSQRGWKKLRYEMDFLFSRGPQVLVLWLALLSVMIILIAAAILTLTGLAPGTEAGYTFIEAAWISLLRTLGSGTIGERSTSWGFRLIMFIVTLGGVFIISALIGALTNSIRERIAVLRKGRSEVMEVDHTVVLGWTEQVFSVVKELVEADESLKSASIVIMAEQDQVEMEDRLRERLDPTGKTRLVCRTGNPMDMTDLNILGLNTARSIIVLSPDSLNPDADVIKIVLAITNHPNRRKEFYHIVAVIRNPKNLEVARTVGRDEVEWVCSGDIISRIIAQTSRQVGLSAVYTELFNFSGNEIYFHQEPDLVNKAFGEVLNAFDNETVIGIARADGSIRLNPSMKKTIHAGDQIILIASDDSQIQMHPDDKTQVHAGALASGAKVGRKAEHMLILGWNWRGHAILRELDHYVQSGSDVLVVADREGVGAEIERGCRNLKNQRVCFRLGDTTERSLLEDLDLDQYDHVILLCYSDRMSIQQADASTMMTLLHLRDLAQKEGYAYSIVTEMLDVRNSRLALVTRADDFIVSDRLISLLLAQVAENGRLNRVFADLFNTSGSELYLKPANHYVRMGHPVNFYTIVEAARRRDEVALGYRLKQYAGDDKRGFGIVLNPAKDEEISLGLEDRIIVLAES